MSSSTFAMLTIMLACMVIVVNIIVEVIKSFSVLKSKPTRVVTTVISIILTVLVAIAYCQHMNITMLWYYYVASVVIGFIVAYGAIFGFDNLYGELLDKVKSLVTSEKER